MRQICEVLSRNLSWQNCFSLLTADDDDSNLTPICLQFDGRMFDLSELLKTQFDEFVGILNTAFDQREFTESTNLILKTKFCHLQAIVEHERLVKSVATVCDKANAITNHEIIKKPTEDTLEAVGNFGDCSSVDSCEQDDNECWRDDSKADETNYDCKSDDIGCEQDDCKPDLSCGRDDITFGNECEHDDHTPAAVSCDRDDTGNTNCKQDDSKPELNGGNLKTDLTEDSFAEILKVNNQKLLDLL